MFISSIKQHNKIVKNYENAKGTISRKILLETARNLNIVHKKGAIVEQSLNMVHCAGNNQNPKIIEIENILKNMTAKEKVRFAKIESQKIYTENIQRKTLLINKDTLITIEINKSGLKETFSKGYPPVNQVKANTYLIIDKICREMIYLETSYDNKTIKYHHFLAPVKPYNNKCDVFVRVVVREFVFENKNNCFYFHEIQYLKNKKEISPSEPLNGVQNIETISSIYKYTIT